MPFVKTPGIIPYVDKSILSEFSYKSVNCRPEVPWVKRWKHGIRFTDEIQLTISSIETERDNNKVIYVNQEQYDQMKSECDNLKLKAKSNLVLTMELNEDSANEYLN